MTPRQVSQTPHIAVGSIHDMLNNNEWPMIDEKAGWTHPLVIPGLEVRIHGMVTHDYRRDWVVFSVWYYGVLTAVGRAAGRERNDSHDHWIVDRTKYVSLANAINSALPLDNELATFELDQEIGDVFSWYGETVSAGKSVNRNY